jgi:hypothetical protein
MRAFIGEFPEKTEDGQDINWDNLFDIDPGTVLRLPTGTEIHEGKQLDVSGFLAQTREDVKELSAVSRTPFPILASDAVNQSAEGASQSEKPLIFKAKDRVRRFSPPADRALRLLVAYSYGDGGTELVGSGAPAVRSIWAPVERHTLGEQSQMVAQLKGVVPTETIMARYLQMLPDELATAKRAARVDAFRQVASGAARGSGQGVAE